MYVQDICLVPLSRSFFGHCHRCLSGSDQGQKSFWFYGLNDPELEMKKNDYQNYVKEVL